MFYFIDTSILGRLANTSDVQHAVATRAVLELHRRGEGFHVAPQVMVEFRNVATRPVAVNGLGLSTADTEALAATFEARLCDGTTEERQNWRLISGGRGIHWPLLDEGISVENLVFGKPSAESQTSLKRWLEGRAGNAEKDRTRGQNQTLDRSDRSGGNKVDS